MSKMYVAIGKKHLFRSKHPPNTLYSSNLKHCSTLTEGVQQQDACVTLSVRGKTADHVLK